MSLSHWRCSGTGPAPRSATTAAGPFLVEMRILPSRRAFCLREQRLELHSRVRSARLGAGGSRRGLRPARGAPPGAPRRCRLSESVAKARIEPGRRRRIVGIPRFPPRPIPSRGAFATDSGRNPVRTGFDSVPHGPCAPSVSGATPRGASQDRTWRPGRIVPTRTRLRCCQSREIMRKSMDASGVGERTILSGRQNRTRAVGFARPRGRSEKSRPLLRAAGATRPALRKLDDNSHLDSSDRRLLGLMPERRRGARDARTTPPPGPGSSVLTMSVLTTEPAGQRAHSFLLTSPHDESR